MNRLTYALLAALLTLLSLAPAAARADGFIVVSPPGPAPFPRPERPGHFVFAPLEVTYHRVTVTINDQVATTTVDQEFYNPNPQRLEGTYLFPLPEGAHIDKFSMDVNGRMQDAELLDAQKARTIYEDIVRRSRDPALLEYVGRDAFKARIFPIEPHSRKPIKITYTQLLKGDTGLVEYTYPLNTEKFSSRPLGDVSVKVNVECRESIKALYSPSHNVEVRREGDRKATVGWEARNVRPDTDFKLILSRTKNPVGVDLLTYRNGPDDGYFLLLASPGMEAPAKQIQSRDVCFVLDTSGSMAEANGKKMEQAKRALSFCLQNLNDGDRFEIIRFSTEAEPFFKELTPATKENVRRALDYVQTLKPMGGTAIEDALDKALKARTGVAGGGGLGAVGDRVEVKWHEQWYPATILKRDEGRAFIKYDQDSDDWNEWVGPDRVRPLGGGGGGPGSGKPAPFAPDARPYVVIFLTDGQPTIGESNEDALVSLVKRANTSNTRIFSFGIGTDVNTHLLDRVASETKSFSQYVLPDEDLEVKVSNFYTKIKEPVLSNVQVEFAGSDVRTSQLYPNVMPDLFKGEMLIAFGRYSGKGPASVKVTGTLNGERRQFVQDVRFADRDTSSPYIPQLWATRRVGWLLDEIRLNGERRELKDEVVRLAREHGIVTPYTAYLIMEDEQRRNVPLSLQNLREFGEDAAAAPLARDKYDSAKREAEDLRSRAGESAVANAKDIDELKSSTNQEAARQQGQRLGKATAGGGPAAAAAASPAADEGYRVARDYSQQSKVVNGRAFYQNGKTWTDSTAQQKPDLKRREVAFNSDAYFDLLKQFPDAAQWLSLGDEVDVVLGDTLYVVR